MSKIKARFQLFSDDEFSSDSDTQPNTSTKSKEVYVGGSTPKEINEEQMKKFQDIKDTLKLVHPQKYDLIPRNTRICYWTIFNTIIFNKYFKEISSDKDIPIIRVGFFTNDKRNYGIPLRNIKKIYTYGYAHEDSHTAKEESDGPLKNTILIKKDEWEKIPTGTTISYKKTKNNKFTYRVRFNSFIDNEKKGRLISLTNITGFNYVIKPNSISEIYRHILPMDFTIIQLLESVNDLKKRVSLLEAKITK